MNVEAMLLAEFQKMTAEDPSMAEDDERFEEDSPELAKARADLDNQWDKALEDACLKGFRVNLNSAAGKRYVLFRNRCAAEAERYKAADDARKRELVTEWLKKQYESYMDRRGRRTRHSQTNV